MTTMTSPEITDVQGASPFGGVLGAPQGRAGWSWRRLLPVAPPRWIVAFLAVPLSAKLVGANIIIVVAALGVALYTHRGEPEDAQLLILMTAALTLSLVVSVGLVLAALRPLRYLEQAAERVSSGDFGARVPASALADRNMARVGGTLNRVLDDLIADRARARRLATEVIRAGDQHSALICRELSESTAQVLAALTFETSALALGSSDPEMKERLEAIRALTSEALEHVGTLAQTVHPRLLDDLGLIVALKGLARRVRATSSVEVHVYSDPELPQIPDATAAMLYRVTEEAVANAVRHGWAECIRIRLTGGDGAVHLMISDDGRGFDPEAARGGSGIGLFMMRERASLAGGIFSIESGTASGTAVRVSLPPASPWVS